MAAKEGPIVDWLEIKSSAPAKFIISGEYSVVHDRLAVAAAVDLRTEVKIRPHKDRVRLNLKNLGVIREWPVISFSSIRFVYKYTECLTYNESMPSQIDHLLNARYCIKDEEPTTSSPPSDEKLRDKKINDATIAFLLLYIGLSDSFWKSYRVPIDVEVESSIPVGSGLGSSSAYSVALCGALMKVFRVSAERYIISNWAFNIDRFFHGRPSGIDNNVVTMGGYILFEKGKIKEAEVSHISPVKVLLIDTQVSRSTRFLCGRVNRMLTEDPDRIDGIFDSINNVTLQVWRNIKDPKFDPRNIADLLQENQSYLDQLEVGHEKLTDICNKAKEFDLRAKQTGAGGGGTAFVLYSPADSSESVEKLKEELLKSGYIVHDHSVGCDGLKVKVAPDPEYK